MYSLDFREIGLEMNKYTLANLEPKCQAFQLQAIRALRIETSSLDW